jgi:hypothetical protein
MTTPSRQRFGATVSTAALGLSLLLAADALVADPLQPDHQRRRIHGSWFDHPHAHVAGGNETEARAYYRKIAEPGHLGFQTPATIENSSIKDLLVYFGFSNVSASDLHRLSSEQLMALGAEGEILATTFFAPKISRVDTPAPATPVGGFGWRKLVRFKARAGSAADTKGMDSLFFLQNNFAASPSVSPFDASQADKTVALFNQAIVTRKAGSGPYNNKKRALFFFAYNSLVKCRDASGGAKSCEANDVPITTGGTFQDDGALGFKLKASFDVRNPETETQGKEFYFVPRSCEDCHGRVRFNAKLNYLDTDHWFDRVKPNYGLSDPRFSQEDFTALTRDVLPDGGPDPTTEKFKKAFDVIRKLNREMRAQNVDAATNSDVAAPVNFPIRAVTKWLALHDPALADATKPVPPFRRGFGTKPWDPANDDERTLLYFFNRYCFRCHSSIKYHVFERSEVLRLKGDIADRVTELTDPKLWMPQDRVFPGLEQAAGEAVPTGDLKLFLDLLQPLQ